MTKKVVRVVLVSGGFDPLHVGHLRYLEAARELGDRLIVALNSDAWLIAKKGYVFMQAVERAEILRGLRYVGEVQILEGDTPDVAAAIRTIRPAVFAKGGDRDAANMPAAELEACREVGAQFVDGVGGYDKPNSSSWLVERATRHFVEAQK